MDVAIELMLLFVHAGNDLMIFGWIAEMRVDADCGILNPQFTERVL